MAKKRKKKRTKVSAERTLETIPKAELDVLACVWRAEPVTARRIREMMLKYRPMAHGSVVTLLNRLERKRLVTKKKGSAGKAFLFQGVRRPDISYKSLVRDMATRVFAQDTAKMVSAVLEAVPPTREEVDVIQRALSRARKTARNSRR